MDDSGKIEFEGCLDNVKVFASLKEIIFNLKNDNLDFSVVKTMEIFDELFPNSFNLIISKFIFSAFHSQKNKIEIYLNYLNLIQIKEEEIDINNPSVITNFLRYILKIKTYESYYIIEKMIQQNMVDKNVIKNIPTRYFLHYYERNRFNDQFSFSENFDEIKRNDWELHKRLIEEGHNPDAIAKIIRNDDNEKLQEITSEANFNFNKIIKPSIYETCSFLNKHDVTIIDYAAFFGAIKCFRFLLMNNADLTHTMKHAIAGGNVEIIHLCEQSNIPFEGVFEAAIEFHRNDAFKYIYENKSDENTKDLNNLGILCINNGNFEIFSFLEKEGLKANEIIINQAAKDGNLYLVKYFLENNQMPNDILLKAIESGNHELVKYILEQKIFNINNSDIILNYLNFL